MFSSPAQDLLLVPAGIIQLLLLDVVPFEQALYPPVDMFEENGVGTGPSTPDTSKHGRNEEKCEPEPCDEEEAQPDILESKGESEEVEPLPQNIKEHCRMPVDRYPGKQDVNKNKEGGGGSAGQSKTTADIGRSQKIA